MEQFDTDAAVNFITNNTNRRRLLGKDAVAFELKQPDNENFRGLQNAFTCLNISAEFDPAHGATVSGTPAIQQIIEHGITFPNFEAYKVYKGRS
jgi:hypothetical protein